MKPFSTNHSISNKIISNIKNDLTPNFKIHKLHDNNFDSLITDDILLQQIDSTIKTATATQDTEITTLQNIKTKSLKSLDHIESSSQTASNQEIMQEITELKDKFVDELFKKTPKPSKFEEFIHTFIINPEEDPIHNYYYLFNINQFYRKLLTNPKYMEQLVKYRLIFDEHLVSIDNEPVVIVKDMLVSFKAILVKIFNTENIVDYVSSTINNEMRQLFVNLVNEFKAYIDSIIKSYNNQFFDFDKLKNKAEILREEDKQNKLTRYNNMTDEDLETVSKLAEIGVIVNMDGDPQNQEDQGEGYEDGEEEYDVVPGEDEDNDNDNDS